MYQNARIYTKSREMYQNAKRRHSECTKSANMYQDEPNIQTIVPQIYTKHHLTPQSTKLRELSFKVRTVLKHAKPYQNVQHLP